ncbi:MAG: rhomboid family intramembrane serine protease [FCB group bacterium]|nr:rhomboid family intramembrane serine protease [FCB group bacterium]MBL7029361.1 rhomboid family intramembrane serine protease [Candidatus Neomarinimicrobiota bacterium]MBL7123044.1 rhomboid family intramembrane serine protease [Candidatus Neomarinimicrobiota bacterium]
MKFGPSKMGDGVRQLLIANVAIFMLSQMMGMKICAGWFGLNPHDVIFGLRIWQPFTYMFLHGGFWHIAMNMLMLWMFGSELENIWGRKEFLRFYVVTGAGAGVFSLVPYFIGVLSGYRGTIPSIIGASGAIYAILLAYAVTYPDRKVLVYMLVPIKVKYLMLIMGFMTFASVGNGDGISHITHLGGLVVGWFFLKKNGRYRGLNIPWRQWIKRFSKFRIVNNDVPGQSGPSASKPQQKGWHRVRSETELRKEMDALLDKITRVGYENLSNTEKERLLELSSQLSDDGDGLD